MHILIGLGIAVVLLYFWLIGHWFARVLVFLLFTFCGLVLGQLAGGIAAGAIGWFVSGIPIYVRKWRVA